MGWIINLFYAIAAFALLIIAAELILDAIIGGIYP